MEGKGVKCTCKVIYSKILLFAGIVGGVLLGILGIVTITADTNDLFASKFVHWYVRDTRNITYTDTNGFNRVEWWSRPNDYNYFSWNSHTDHTLVETDSHYIYLETGFHSETTSVGRITLHLHNATIDTHYYCMTPGNSHVCGPLAADRLKIHLYKGTLFYTNGYLGNQNMRWTFFLLAVLSVAFGVIMILGELHVPVITTKFTFFYYSFVKGIIYVAYGFLVMGMSNVFGLAVAIYMWLLGIFNCIYGWRSLTSFKWNKIGERGTTTVVTRREYI